MDTSIAMLGHFIADDSTAATNFRPNEGQPGFVGLWSFRYGKKAANL